uniref:Uncharacterized protein n=1 Tax=Anguilla anguilla TaxID=7936 RepID=A0A0E9XUQ7_ANGAN
MYRGGKKKKVDRLWAHNGPQKRRENSYRFSYFQFHPFPYTAEPHTYCFPDWICNVDGLKHIH